ncbi:hypothetical protein L228DRAFT_21658 [Xylona heveae TC161]|uniref:AAA+ ATPase domain-containing protein n=1 Tax=Xylona heveae (strain CBS 132557 / TC161) TaxID=1328760 RepID=A0A165K2Q3_XYLHT|nr:hypothetical protein L228DRAFT_21658 [Xylona heveae TC161]KZF26918.1 hypothetical protein L228DRAFT_21658 [Xylona heveae TC161]
MAVMVAHEGPKIAPEPPLHPFFSRPRSEILGETIANPNEPPINVRKLPHATQTNDNSRLTTLDPDPNASRSKRRKTEDLEEQSVQLASGPLGVDSTKSSEEQTKNPTCCSKLPVPANLQASSSQFIASVPASTTSMMSSASEKKCDEGSIEGPENVTSETFKSLPAVSQGDFDSPQLLALAASHSPHVVETASGATMNSPGQPQTSQPLEISCHKDVPATNSPPRKMLKLNSRGTFSSPVSGSTSANVVANQKARTKKGTRKAQNSHFLVIIKYGSDRDSRTATGKKIEYILCGSSVSPPPPPPPSLPLTLTSESLQIVTKQLESAKPTHPFFLQSGRQRTRAEEKPSQTISQEGTKTSLQTLSPTNIKAHRPESEGILPPLSSKKPASVTYVSGSGSFRAAKNRGLLEAAWPWKDVVHVRGLDEQRPFSHASVVATDMPLRSERKLKQSAVQVTESEDLLSNLSRDLDINSAERSLQETHDNLDDNLAILRLPRREIMTGLELQRAVDQQLETKFLLSQTEASASTDTEDALHAAQAQPRPAHPALRFIYQNIPTYLGPFDKAACETHSWVQKYAPGSAEHVLQSGKEALVLREWLLGMTVQSTVTPSRLPNEMSSSNSKRSSNGISKQQRSKKKRKRDDELQDFIVSTDEEGDQMDELTDPEDDFHWQRPSKSVIRTFERSVGSRAAGEPVKVRNAVIISGPHGCGKTAAVYAVAKELDFEVFEINSGSRRSGKDILDKVGEMTKNHLVNHPREASKSGPTAVMSEGTEESTTIHQGRMTSFFAPKGRESTQAKDKAPKAKGNPERHPEPQQSQRSQKQSLILLEEVDVLFEEDKQFWLTVLTLISQSKRPVILTCNDESVLPIDALSPHAILRFKPPPEHLALDYLLLLAAREGHLLQRNAVHALYRARNSDFRAAIAELDFWCQMAVGDRKGGLEWIPDLKPSHVRSSYSLSPSRVVSTNTYLSGMGWTGRDYVHENGEDSVMSKQELMKEAWDNWQADLLEWKQAVGCQHNDQNAAPSKDNASSAVENLASLKFLEDYAEYLSADDAFTGIGFGTGHESSVDATLPSLTDKVRSNYIEGSSLLQAGPITDFANFLPQIRYYVAATAEEVFLAQLQKNGFETRYFTAVDESSTIYLVSHLREIKDQQKLVHRSDLSKAFDPISEPPNANQSTAQSYALQACCFDGTFRLIIEEIAPFVRAIVSFDLRLEEQRLRLSSLLSQGGTDRKRLRTTRSSRSALEGGVRSLTRRDRWFTQELNPNLVLKTGSSIWRDACALAYRTFDPSLEGDNSDIGRSSRRDSDSTVTECSA